MANPTISVSISDLLLLQGKFAQAQAEQDNSERLREIEAIKADMAAKAALQNIKLQAQEELSRAQLQNQAQLQQQQNDQFRAHLQQETANTRAQLEQDIANRLQRDLTQREIDKLKKDLEKAKEKPPEPLIKQFLALAPTFMQTLAVTIPTIGALTIDGMKFFGGLFTAGVAIYAIGETGTTVVNAVDKVVTGCGTALDKANTHSKIILGTMAAAAILKGAHSLATEGAPPAVSKGMKYVSEKINGLVSLVSSSFGNGAQASSMQPRKLKLL